MFLTFMSSPFVPYNFVSPTSKAKVAEMLQKITYIFGPGLFILDFRKVGLESYGRGIGVRHILRWVVLDLPVIAAPHGAIPPL